MDLLEDAVVILHCNFEELAALRAGARECLAAVAGHGHASGLAVHDDVGALLPRLAGDLSIETLEEQESVERALEHILAQARERMDATVLELYVGAEDAVNAYFDYANVLTVHDRVRRIGREMAMMIELMTGGPATEDEARRIHFPD